ncbi:unnamed protein product [Amoebophrya sp. A120]|nr:unnamed protein product [Amoebophrya sp. A120]|eukprot:GSA120T00003936001.1
MRSILAGFLASATAVSTTVSSAKGVNSENSHSITGTADAGVVSADESSQASTAAEGESSFLHRVLSEWVPPWVSNPNVPNPSQLKRSKAQQLQLTMLKVDSDSPDSQHPGSPVSGVPPMPDANALPYDHVDVLQQTGQQHRDNAEQGNKVDLPQISLSASSPTSSGTSPQMLPTTVNVTLDYLREQYEIEAESRLHGVKHNFEVPLLASDDDVRSAAVATEAGAGLLAATKSASDDNFSNTYNLLDYDKVLAFLSLKSFEDFAALFFYLAAAFTLYYWCWYRGKSAGTGSGAATVMGGMMSTNKKQLQMTNRKLFRGEPEDLDSVKIKKYANDDFDDDL